MSNKEVVETTEVQIAVHWKEEDYYHPSTTFIAQANLKVCMNLGKAIAYFVQLAEMMTPVRSGRGRGREG